MANTTFPNIDFKFRRGFKDAFKMSSFKEGTINFIKDTGDLYLQKDGLSIKIGDIIFDYGTEAAIKANTNPEAGKIYLSSDTFKLLYFDRPTLTWKVVGTSTAGECEFATSAQKDSEGNVINDYYYAKEEAITTYNSINSRINTINEAISRIIDFTAVKVNSMDELPVEGVPGTVYLVPASSYYGEDTANETANNHTVELLYFQDPVYGGYYEVIGNTNVNIDNIYTKDEVNNLLAAFRTQIQAELATFRTQITEMVNQNRSMINSIQSSINTKIAGINANIASINGTDASQTSRLNDLERSSTYLDNSIDTIRGNITTINTNISGLTTATADQETRLTAIETDTTTSSAISACETRLATAEGNITTLQTDVAGNSTNIDNLGVTVNSHTSSISTINGNIGTINSDIAGINSSIDTIDMSLGTITGDIENIQSDITTVQGDITTINGDITNIEGDISTINTNVSGLDTRLTTAEGKITNLENVNYEGRITQNADDIATINTTLSNYRGRINTLESTDTVFDNRITRLESFHPSGGSTETPGNDEDELEIEPNDGP